MDSTQNQSLIAHEPQFQGLRLERVPVERTRQYASPHEWAQYKPFMKRLYVVEGRTLQDVMETMKREFDFNAT
jgi:hypothetical protein